LAVEPGTFEVLIGSSSENIHLRGSFKVEQIARKEWQENLSVLDFSSSFGLFEPALKA